MSETEITPTGGVIPSTAEDRAREREKRRQKVLANTKTRLDFLQGKTEEPHVNKEITPEQKQELENFTNGGPLASLLDPTKLGQSTKQASSPGPMILRKGVCILNPLLMMWTLAEYHAIIIFFCVIFSWFLLEIGFLLSKVSSFGSGGQKVDMMSLLLRELVPGLQAMFQDLGITLFAFVVLFFMRSF